MFNQQEAEASIVRIFAADGTVVGTGFLVEEASVLTCAHVVAAALDIAEDAPTKPEVQVYLDFPLRYTWTQIQRTGQHLATSAS